MENEMESNMNHLESKWNAQPHHDDDLAAIVKIARLANALAFAQRAYLDAVHHPTHIRRRQLHQATFLIGATLYRALRESAMASHLYGDRNYFSGLKDFIKRTREYEPVLKRLAESPAVTFETDAEATYPMLEQYFLDVADVSACCERWEPGHLYFPAVHALDTEHFADDVAHILNGDQLYDFVKTMLSSLSDRFLSGSKQFLAGLARKAELTRQVWREARNN